MEIGQPEEICGIHEAALSADNILVLDRALDRDGNITDMKTSNLHRCLKLPGTVADELRNRLARKIYREKGKSKSSDTPRDSLL